MEETTVGLLAIIITLLMWVYDKIENRRRK